MVSLIRLRRRPAGPKTAKLAQVLVFILLLVTLPPAIADSKVEINEMVVFGASYSDTGNVFLATNFEIPPSPPYLSGRFSNGPLWHEIVAYGLGIPPALPDLIGGTNYAWGGAETGEGIAVLGVPNLGQQIDTYLAQSVPRPDQLFLVVGGGNDIIPPGPPKSAEEIVDNLAAHITELAQAGARYFAVPNLPTIEQFPLVKALDEEAADELAEIARQTNRLLRRRLIRLEWELKWAGTPVEIAQVNWNVSFWFLSTFPSLIGVENTTDPALISPGCPPCTGVLVPNPNDYFWFDNVHPTAPVHLGVGLFALGDIRRQLFRHHWR